MSAGGDGGTESGSPAAPPFPKLRPVERGAAMAFAIGTLCMTATFGVRTAVFQPDYYAEPTQITLLAVHGAAELFVALILGFLVVWIHRAGVAKALLAILAVVSTIVKGLFLIVFISLGEPNPWAQSPGTLALCALVTVPLWLSYFPVLSALSSARGAHLLPVADPESTSQNTPPPLDSPFDVRAALCAWLATVGLGSFLLGPDWLVRAWASITIGAAAAHFAIGLAEEKRVWQWARQAIGDGVPAHVHKDDPPPAGVPSLIGGQARKATLFSVSEQAGSYRKEPRKEPIAAIEPGALKKPKSFADRVARRLRVPMVYTILAVAISWPLLHSSDLPPRAVTSTYSHERITPYTSYSIEGLTLWLVRRGERGNYVVGVDPETHTLIEGEALFRRVRGISTKGDLAELANSMLYNGECSVLRGTDPGWPKDESGESPKAPSVEGGKLVFWRAWDGKSYRSEAPYVEGMLNTDGSK